MTEQGSGGYSVMECHYCHEPVTVCTGVLLHVDHTPLCREEPSDEMR